MSTTSGLIRTVRSAITPECNNLGRSIKTSSWLIVVFLAIAIILMLIAVIYNYKGTPKSTVPATTGAGAGAGASGGTTATTDEDKKNKIVDSLSIAGMAFTVISLLISIWSASVVGKAANNCLIVQQ